MTEELLASDPQERFQDFLKSEKYRERISRLALTGGRSLIVEFGDLLSADSGLAEAIIEKPDEYLLHANRAALAQLRIEAPEYAEKVDSIKVRFRGLPIVTSLRTLGSHHIGKLVMIKGVIIRATPVNPLVVTAAFKCKRCGAITYVDQKSAFLTQPIECSDPTCRRRGPFEFLQDESVFVDAQEIRIQESPEDLPPGQLPRWINIKLNGRDIVDIARPGDNVSVTGPESVSISPEEEKRILELAKDPWIHRKIIRSIAPSIYGYEHIKESIMYLLFGGVPKTLPDINIRGDLNVLLIGDPGTAKSQLLQYVARIAPRGLYTSGRGTTAAGLTAAVLREREGGMTLEAGALVLADKGVACIDEIDKMKPEDRVAIHEAMEQHTVSVAKGGIVATLNARTSILAAANPSLGRYEPHRTVAENISLPVTILSRFDLIFVLRDLPNKDFDAKMSAHILGLHRTGAVPVDPPIPADLLKKYISYARNLNPVMGEEAAERIKDFYLSMRAASEAEGSPVAITARQLESLVRIAEARARSALRKEVTAEDAEAAITIMKRSLEQVGIDVTSRKFDIDLIMTGKPKSLRDKLQVVLGVIIDFEILEEDYEIGFAEAERLIGQLVKEGTVYTPREGYLKKT